MVTDESSNEEGKEQVSLISPAPVSPETATEVSPLEELKRLNEENKKVLSEMKEERKKIEKAAAELLVSGRSFAGQNSVGCFR